MTPQDIQATLLLDNGAVFHGISFGHTAPVSGEVVFSTAMVGYPESLTDPSYAGQLLTLTFPLIGNYGVPPCGCNEEGISLFNESEKIHAQALIVSDYSQEYSHWNARESLGAWLKREEIVGISGIDTRELTKILRKHGSMRGKIVFDDTTAIDFVDSNAINQVARVSCKEVITYPGGEKRVVVVDCGVKHNIIRCLQRRNLTIIRVPWDYDFTSIPYHGLFLSNGPGNPDTCAITVEHIRKAIEVGKPIFGICLGNQLLAKAAGATTYKLKYGHRSHNQPVRMKGSNRCFVTSQNHGYAVDTSTLESDWEVLFENMNDGTNEGIRHKSKPFFSAQFHPEAASGPTDTEFLFDTFVSLINDSSK